jgi:hypothetical protein
MADPEEEELYLSLQGGKTQVKLALLQEPPAMQS